MEKEEKILEMNANFFSLKEGGCVCVSAKIAKLHFIKDLLAMTEGDC